MESNSLLMPATALGAPTLELGDGAATSGSKEQDGTAIGRGHLPELGPEALIIRVSFAASFPRQPIDLLRASLDGVLILQFQIELHGLLQALTARLIALARSDAAAELDEDDGEGEKGEEADNVRELEVVAMEVEGEGGRGEEERE